MAEEGTGGRGRGERGGRRKGPEREGEGRKREGPHDTLAWGPQCLNPALTISSAERSSTAGFIVWQPRRAADTSTNWRQGLFCCCTASMEQAADEAETAAIDGLVSSRSENISVSFCLRAPRYGLTL